MKMLINLSEYYNYLFFSSILLNIFLGVVLYFKSALNSILTEWWKKKKSEKIVYREKLVNMKIVCVYERDNFALLIAKGQAYYNNDINSFTFLDDINTEAKNEKKEIINKSKVDLLSMTSEIQKKYEFVNEIVGKYSEESLSTLMNEERKKAVKKDVKLKYDEIIKLIDEQFER